MVSSRYYLKVELQCKVRARDLDGKGDELSGVMKRRDGETQTGDPPAS